MEILHKRPYRSRKNNRKLTIGRIKAEKAANVQSIPIYGKEGFMGYKYIFHKHSIT